MINKIDLLKIINLCSKTTIISAAHCCEIFETYDIDNSEIIVGQIGTTGTSEVEFIQDWNLKFGKVNSQKNNENINKIVENISVSRLIFFPYISEIG